MNKITIISILICILLSGCTEAQKQPVWGTGELPADYVSFFGEDNTARLNKAQNDLLNKHEVLLRGINQTKDGKVTHINGVIDLIVNLESRVKALEVSDANAFIPHTHADIPLTYPDKEGMVRYVFTDSSGDKGRLEVHNGNEWISFDKPEDIMTDKLDEKQPIDTGPWYFREEIRDLKRKINEIINRINEREK